MWFQSFTKMLLFSNSSPVWASDPGQTWLVRDFLIRLIRVAMSAKRIVQQSLGRDVDSVL